MKTDVNVENTQLRKCIDEISKEVLSIHDISFKALTDEQIDSGDAIYTINQKTHGIKKLLEYQYKLLDNNK